MWNWARFPLAVTVVLDLLLIGGIVVLRGQGAYEAAILTAYLVAAIGAVQVVLCVTGLYIDKGPWQRYIYGGHLIGSLLVFIVAELGGFR